MLIIFYDIKGIVHKESILAGETINSAYYCDFYGDCMKMCKDFALKFGDKLTKSNKIVVPIHSLVPCDFSLFPQLNMKLRGCHFNIIEVIETEMQAVLNTEHDFQDALKKWQKCWEWCICMERDFFKNDVGQ
jgi:NAD-dependent dihydropyrimidine dehydrogenase PreA subunit